MILILDIDWIFTDWKHHYWKEWKIFKSFWSNDRFIINLLREQNLFEDIYCVTWDRTWNWIEISKIRIENELNIKVVSVKQQWFSSKYDYLESIYWAEFVKSSVVYVGDDLADLKIINECFWSATTKNAPSIVKKYCDYVSEYEWWNWWLADILIEYMRIKWINVEALLLK